MTADVLTFPGAAARPASPVGLAVRAVVTRRRYTFAQVIRLLDMTELTERTQIAHLRRLHRQAGFPLPRNPRFWKGALQRGADAICRGSIWSAVAVDDWRDAQERPPPSADALGIPRLPQSRRDAMRHAARAIGQA